ncbi:MAG: hypothetical protein LBC82_03970 [Oscillospiraceae bacterium]|jgi:hypothetical protein|nr:hypothetical protein [Oscillospiraceae bacterium]
MKIKKITAIILMLAMILTLLTGCGGANPDKEFEKQREREKESIVQMLEEIKPVQIAIESAIGSDKLYWINMDGTVGTNGGTEIVTEWENIIKIRVNSRYITALNKDGILFCYNQSNKVLTTYENILDFDIGIDRGIQRTEYIIAMLKTDGTIDLNGTSNRIQCGLDNVNRWTDVKSIRFFVQTLTNEIQDPADGNTKRSQLIIDALCLAAETNSGEILFSGFELKIVYPSESEIARGIADSIRSGEGWDIVFDSDKRSELFDNNRNSSDIAPKEVTVIPVDMGFNEFNKQERHEYRTQGTYFIIQKDSDGNWVVS